MRIWTPHHIKVNYSYHSLNINYLNKIKGDQQFLINMEQFIQACINQTRSEKRMTSRLIQKQTTIHQLQLIHLSFIVNIIAAIHHKYDKENLNYSFSGVIIYKAKNALKVTLMRVCLILQAVMKMKVPQLTAS